jgi:hypothetical protein
MSEKDLDLNWNEHEWRQYYRLRQVVEELSKVAGMGAGALFGYGAYRTLPEWGWPGWAVTSGWIIAALAGFILVMRQLDLDRG